MASGKKDGRQPKSKKPKRKGKKGLGADARTNVIPAAELDDKRAEKRVAALREKLRKSMEDPDMRNQMVRAIRIMMNEK